MRLRPAAATLRPATTDSSQQAVTTTANTCNDSTTSYLLTRNTHGHRPHTVSGTHGAGIAITESTHAAAGLVALVACTHNNPPVTRFAGRFFEQASHIIQGGLTRRVCRLACSPPVLPPTPPARRCEHSESTTPPPILVPATAIGVSHRAALPNKIAFESVQTSLMMVRATLLTYSTHVQTKQKQIYGDGGPLCRS